MTPGAPGRPARRVRICYFNTWAGPLQTVADYLARLPGLDLRPLVSNAGDPELMRKARLYCDWYGENARCFAAMARFQFPQPC